MLKSAVKMFPNVAWTGGSSIHVSKAAEWGVNIPFSDKAALMQYLNVHQHSKQILSYFQKTFKEFDWMLTPEDFYSLFMADMYRWLKEQPSTISSKMIENPSTGNIFHVIGRTDKIQGGPRFWAYGSGSRTTFGFRFRIVETDEEEEDTRERIRISCEEAQVSLEEMTQTIDIQEPVANPEPIKELGMVLESEMETL